MEKVKIVKFKILDWPADNNVLEYNFPCKKDVRRQLNAIKDLWDGFSEDEKPEWLTMEQIVQYEKEILK